jgi:hypothetical protein
MMQAALRQPSSSTCKAWSTCANISAGCQHVHLNQLPSPRCMCFAGSQWASGVWACPLVYWCGGGALCGVHIMAISSPIFIKNIVPRCRMETQHCTWQSQRDTCRSRGSCCALELMLLSRTRYHCAQHLLRHSATILPPWATNLATNDIALPDVPLSQMLVILEVLVSQLTVGDGAATPTFFPDHCIRSPTDK